MKGFIAVVLSLALMTFGASAFAAVEEGTEITWNERKLSVLEIREGDEGDAGDEVAEGRFVEIVIATSLTVKFGEIKDLQAQLALVDANGGAYTPVSLFGTLGESARMEMLATARLSNVTARFDIPAETDMSELTLRADGANADETAASGIPEELVGDWIGTGKPVDGGSAISLQATVDADGAGSYTFEQAGYTESYPITLLSADQRFTVDIPEENELDIVRCEGTYSYADGVLTLNITTTFADGRIFEYVVDCEKVEQSVTLSYEDETYTLTYESAEIVDDALNMGISGFGNIMHMRDGQIVVPIWAYVIKDGVKYRASSVSCDSSGVYTYIFDLAELPAEVLLYSVEDKDSPVLLKSGGFDAGKTAAADADTATPEYLFGTWRLDGIDFLTPEENDIYSIDAGMTLDKDAKGNTLTLNADKSMVSDVDIDGLVAAVDALPFETKGLNLGAYEHWNCDGDALLLSPDGVSLHWHYDEAEEALRILWADEVEIASTGTSAGTSAGGTVQMQITLNFVRLGAGEEADVSPVQTTIEPAAEAADESAAEPIVGASAAEEMLAQLDSPLYDETYAYLLAGNTIEKGENSNYGKGLQTLLVALGQDISIDGQVGAKTITAMNEVRGMLGMEANEGIGAPCFERLLTCLFCLHDEDAAYAILVDGGYMTEDELTYLRACGFELTGQYYKAYQAFCLTGWEDANERAEGCAQDWPKNGEVYRNSDYTAKKTYLHFAIDSQDAGQAALIKFYAENGDLVSCLFIGGAGEVTVKLPGGVYTVKMGVGERWFGVQDAFGKEGRYETMIFDGGADSVTLKSGYEYTLTVNTSVSDPEADDVGSEYEEYEEF
jgi:hypothetical protein